MDRLDAKAARRLKSAGKERAGGLKVFMRIAFGRSAFELGEFASQFIVSRNRPAAERAEKPAQHLVCGGLCVSHAEDCVRICALAAVFPAQQEAGDTVDQDFRLAGAGMRLDPGRTVRQGGIRLRVLRQTVGFAVRCVSHLHPPQPIRRAARGGHSPSHIWPISDAAWKCRGGWGQRISR